MKVIALVQARLGSVRLPEKVLRQITDKPLIELLLTRLSCSTEINENNSIDNYNRTAIIELQLFVESLGFQCSRGSEKDVLKRFYESAKHFNADIVVRITGDCPLIDSRLVDQCIQGFKDANVDYFSNIDPTTFPDGLDVEVMSFIALERAHLEAVSSLDREHVTTYIRNTDSFLKSSIQYSQDLSNVRLTVDEPEDLNVVTKIFQHFYC